LRHGVFRDVRDVHTHYCSKPCQFKHWPVHKIPCKESPTYKTKQELAALNKRTAALKKKNAYSQLKDIPRGERGEERKKKRNDVKDRYTAGSEFFLQKRRAMNLLVGGSGDNPKT
jgi:hypothetical protein